MKKIVISLSLIIAILLSSTSVFAARFESLGMNIDLPKEYYNLKAGVDTGEAKVEFYTAMMQTTKEALANEYKLNSILYNGINSNLSNEIYISSTENKLTKSIFHLSEANDEKFEEVSGELKNVATNQGLKTDSQESYTNGGIRYIHSVMTKSKLTVYQYYTIVNGIGITISLHSSDSSAKNDELKKIVDSISFDELQEKPVQISSYILIGVTIVLVVMVLVLMYMAFFSKKVRRDYNEPEENEVEENDEE